MRVTGYRQGSFRQRGVYRNQRPNEIKERIKPQSGEHKGRVKRQAVTTSAPQFPGKNSSCFLCDVKTRWHL
jgi:hypothetical protein